MYYLIDFVSKDYTNIKEAISMGGQVLELKTDKWLAEIERLKDESERLKDENKKIKDTTEARLGSLICMLINNNCDQYEIIKVSTDETYREKMYKKYNL